MNIDIRLSLGFLDHPKTLKLQKRAGVNAVLCLIRLWIWAAEQRSSGVLSDMDGEDVELAAKWDGEEGKFIRTLLDCRWVDEKDGVFFLHGWDEHQQYACKSEERSSHARKAAEERWAKHKHADSNASSMPDDAPSINEHADSNAPITNNQDTNNQLKKERVNTPARAKEPKEPYGQFGKVKLTVKEHLALIDKFGIEGAQERIENLDEYIASKGARYSSHYATILNWDRRDAEEQKKTARPTSYAQQIKFEQDQQARALLAASQRRREENAARLVANGGTGGETQPSLPPWWGPE